jgi:hypothetical protein
MPSSKDTTPDQRYANARELSERRLRSLGYDTVYDVYRERAKDLAASREFLDRLAYEFLGPDLIASTAFALDPYRKFKFSTAPVTAVNRKRVLTGVTGTPRSYTYRTPNSTKAIQMVFGVWSPDFNSSGTTPSGGATLTSQANIDGYLYDTSRSTRQGTGSEVGEMELYIPRIQTTPWNYTWRERDNISINDAPPITYYHARSIKDHETVVKGPTQWMSKSSHDVWFNAYKSAALVSLTKAAPGMAAKCLPTSRLFALNYNIAELRDLPRLLRDSVKRLKDLENFLRRLPSSSGGLYLEYKFAWESTFKAVQDMLELPEKIAKRVNYLLSRNGKLTTLRYRYRYTEALSSFPTLNFETYPYDVALDSTSVRGSHAVEMRCAVNAQIDLPHVDIPELRKELLTRLWGLDAQPSDIYNLVPWTWLFDWFGGMAEYLNVIETLSNDTSLVNYGFVSFISRGEVVSHLKLKADGNESIAISGQPTQNRVLKYRPNRDARFIWKYHLRRSIASLAGVKTISGMTGLSDSQKAIVTALATKKRGGNP